MRRLYSNGLSCPLHLLGQCHPTRGKGNNSLKKYKKAYNFINQIENGLLTN